jgi:hypothetical protein
MGCLRVWWEVADDGIVARQWAIDEGIERIVFPSLHKAEPLKGCLFLSNEYESTLKSPINS